VQQEIRVALDDAVELPPVVVPEPELDTEAPDPLFSTLDDFVTATRHLIEHKALTAKYD
jgi:hypothetical protein